MSGLEWLLVGFVGIVTGALGFLIGNDVAWRQKPSHHQAVVNHLNATIEQLRAQLDEAQQECTELRKSRDFGWQKEEEMARIIVDHFDEIAAAMGKTPKRERLLEWAILRAPKRRR